MVDTIFIYSKKEYFDTVKRLKKEGFKRQLTGYVEKWTRNEWTKDNAEKSVYISIEY